MHLRRWDQGTVEKQIGNSAQNSVDDQIGSQDHIKQKNKVQDIELIFIILSAFVIAGR